MVLLSEVSLPWVWLPVVTCGAEADNPPYEESTEGPLYDLGHSACVILLRSSHHTGIYPLTPSPEG